MREQFAHQGITYRPSQQSKSQRYAALLPAANAGRVALLDHPRLTAQLVALERYAALLVAQSVEES